MTSTSPTLPNHYETLGLQSTATAREIKRAFVRKQKENHPDKAGVAVDYVVQLNAAKNVLLDPAARIEYDLEMGFRDNTLETRQQLFKYRKLQAERIRESQVETASASKQLEAKVYLRQGKKKLKDAGLIITKARFGVLPYKAKRSSLEDFAALTEKPEMKAESEAMSEIAASPSSMTTESTKMWIDVTDACQCMVQHRGRNGGFIELKDNTDKSRLPGFYDPSPEESGPRHLEVEYMFQRRFHFARAENFEYLIVPHESHLVDVFKLEDQPPTPTSEEKDAMGSYVRTAMSTYTRSVLQEELERENFDATLNADDILEIDGRLGYVQRSSLQDLRAYDETDVRKKGRSFKDLRLTEVVIVGVHVGVACVILCRKVDGSRFPRWLQSVFSSL